MMVTNNCLYQCHRSKDCCPKVFPFGTVLATKTDESQLAATRSEHTILNTPAQITAEYRQTSNTITVPRVLGSPPAIPIHRLSRFSYGSLL